MQRLSPGWARFLAEVHPIAASARHRVAGGSRQMAL